MRDVTEKEWVEIYPYGIALGADAARPILIFKDEYKKYVLPVWLNPADAGMAISEQSHYSATASGHNLFKKIMNGLDLKLEACHFTEVRGHHQFVELHFSGNTKLQKLESRADEAMSFCLSGETRFYCEPEFFDKCRNIEIKMSDMTMDLAKRPSIGKNKHPYLN